MTKIGQVFYEIHHFGPSEGPEGKGFLAKVSVEDPANYHISVDAATGELQFTPKPQKADPFIFERRDKYRTEPEDGLLRIYALRDIPKWGVTAGQMGGLIFGTHNLSQAMKSSAWVWPGAKVLGNSLVNDDAKIGGGTVVDGAASINGFAVVNHSTVNGYISLAGTVNVSDSQLTATRDGYVQMQGDVTLDDTIIETGDNHLHLNGGNIVSGHIRTQHEVIPYPVAPWGWLTGYRDKTGRLRFRVGCQDLFGAEELRDIAEQYSISQVSRDMLEPFLAMVEVAQRSWVSESKSDETAEPVQEGDTPSAVPVAD